METPTLTEHEMEQLIDDLVRALDEMVTSSCKEMVPLWLAGTRLARRDLADPAQPDMGIELSDRYLSLSRGTQNRYRGLACWRHAVIWQEALAEVDPDFAAATRVLYFTPYPRNEPPYAWSTSAAEAPGAEDYDSPSSLKNQAKEGCWASLRVLHRRSRGADTLLEEVVCGLIKTGCRRTLRDTLKLEQFDPWTTE